MKQLIIPAFLAKNGRLALSFLFITFISIPGLAQKTDDWKLEKMPADLETDFALSSLPPHIRSGTTVYLLDPEKGYYIARQGTNGFISFVLRTQWEHPVFRKDMATAISFDAAGAKAIFPVYMDVAAMRASGKFTAMQIHDTIAARYNNGTYKAPERQGISYMLAPFMRSYYGNSDQVLTFSIPHYMCYAPYLTEADIGGNSADGGAVMLGDGKSPHQFIMIPAGQMEKAAILKANKDLLKRLTAYKPYFEIEESGMKH